MTASQFWRLNIRIQFLDKLGREIFQTPVPEQLAKDLQQVAHFRDESPLTTILIALNSYVDWTIEELGAGRVALVEYDDVVSDAQEKVERIFLERLDANDHERNTAVREFRQTIDKAREQFWVKLRKSIDEAQP